MNMKRWYVFFLLVAVLTGLAGFGIFGGSTQDVAEPGGAGKILFLTLLAVGGVVFAFWLAFSSAHKSELGSGNVDPRSQPNPPDWKSPRARRHEEAQRHEQHEDRSHDR